MHEKDKDLRNVYNDLCNLAKLDGFEVASWQEFVAIVQYIVSYSGNTRLLGFVYATNNANGMCSVIPNTCAMLEEHGYIVYKDDDYNSYNYTISLSLLAIMTEWEQRKMGS